MSISRTSRAFCVFLSTLLVLSSFPLSALRADDTKIKYYSVEEGKEFEVEQVTTSTWGGHANIELKIKNTGDEIIDNWHITFETPYVIENIWNATIVETDNRGTYTIRNSYYNQDIGTNSEVTIGMTLALGETELGSFSDWYLLNTKTYEVESERYFISYQEYSKWNGGFNGALILSSMDYIEDWTLSFDSNYEITTISNATIESSENGSYTITNDGFSQNLSSNMLLMSIQGIPAGNDLTINNVLMTSVGMAYGLSDDEDNNGIADYLEYIYSIEDIDPITPTPTDEPTVTQVPTITGQPTNEPTVTPESTITTNPTPTEEPDLDKDSDEDGLPDWLEIELGTDIEEADSDFDNLSDLMEYLIGYNPADPDTDKDGIPDGDEDYDGDRITNIQEIEIGTEFYLEDSDFDLLNDGDELEIYGTDPTKYDTDGDEISDGDEVAMGKDPNDPTDKNSKVYQTKIFEIKNESAPALRSVEVSIDLSENIDLVADVDDLYGKQVYLSGLRGRIGSPVDITCTEDFETATVSFYYDDSVLGQTNEDDLVLLWYNEENGLFVEQEQAVLDTMENTITVELEHFSKYIIVDSKEWYSHVDFYGYETETYTGYYDYYYAFDISSKMTSEARELAWNSFVEFTDNMRSGDRVVPLLFSSSSCLYYAPMMTKDHMWFDDMMDATESFVKNQVKDEYSCYYRAFNGVVNVNDPSYDLVDDIGNRRHLIIISSDSEPESVFNGKIDYMRSCMAYSSFTVSIYNIAPSMSSTSQIFSPGKAYADQLLLEYRIDSPIPMTMTYAPDYSIDNDKDGLPDYIEENGMFCIGMGGNLIYTDTNPEIDESGKAIGYDSDDDGLSDKEEMGIQYTVSMNYNGYITIKKGDLVLVTFLGTISNNSEYKCFRPYIPAAGKSNIVFAPIADPNNSDTDGDRYEDLCDLYPNCKAYDYIHFEQVASIDVNIPYIQDYFLEDQCIIDNNYNINSAYVEELYPIYNALNAAADLSDQTLLHSSSALKHYLDNTGEVYSLSLSELIYLRETPSNRDQMISILEAMKRKNLAYMDTCSLIATIYYYENMLHLLKHAKSVLKDGDTITIMQVVGQNEEITSFKISEAYQMIDLDWLLTLGVGGSKAGIVAEVTRSKEEYSISFYYCVYDVYDWELEFSIVPWMPSDAEISELHKAGLAKEYIVFGDNTSSFCFNSEAIDSVNSFLKEII